MRSADNCWRFSHSFLGGSDASGVAGGVIRPNRAADGWMRTPGVEVRASWLDVDDHVDGTKETAEQSATDVDFDGVIRDRNECIACIIMPMLASFYEKVQIAMVQVCVAM